MMTRRRSRLIPVITPVHIQPTERLPGMMIFVRVWVSGTTRLWRYPNLSLGYAVFYSMPV
jgi:hypothetical protein